MNKITLLARSLLLTLATIAFTSCQNRAMSHPDEQGSNAVKTVQELPLNIAHRGARSLAPENTLQAARLGLQTGADLWELDVTMTADGDIVVIHDDTLERTSNAAQVFPDRSPWSVQTFTLSELHQLDFGSWFVQSDPFQQIQAGAISAEQAESYRGTPIPTLKEALVFTRDHSWKVNVEIKDGTGTPADPVIANAVVRQVVELGMEDQVIISSFNQSYLQKVREANARVTTAVLVISPHPDPVGLLQQLGAQAYNPGLKYLDMDQLATVRAAGFGVNVWTVNDPQDMRRLIEAGVSGIFTDFPQVLEQVLEEYRGK